MDAGLRDGYAGPGLKIAEWPDRAADLLPAPDVGIDIASVGEGAARTATFTAHSARGRELLG